MSREKYAVKNLRRFAYTYLFYEILNKLRGCLSAARLQSSQKKLILRSMHVLNMWLSIWINRNIYINWLNLWLNVWLNVWFNVCTQEYILLPLLFFFTIIIIFPLSLLLHLPFFIVFGSEKKKYDAQQSKLCEKKKSINRISLLFFGSQKWPFNHKNTEST